MSHALKQFETNMAGAADAVGLGLAIDAATTDALDAGDLLRFALVSAVSALDYYVHQVVRELMVETAQGNRQPTDAFQRFTVSAEVALRVAGGESARTWMDEEVRRQHGHLSFQHPDRITEAIRLVWSGSLWATIAPLLGTTPSALKQDLRLVVARRNQIAHEADRDPTPPHERWPISAPDVGAAIQLVLSLGRAIDSVL